MAAKDQLGLEIELELALEVEDQIRASAMEYEQAEESLSKQISDLRLGRTKDLGFFQKLG